MAKALLGCVIKEDKANTIVYQKKCEGCGALQNGTTLTAVGPKGSKLNTTFSCSKCRKLSKLVIQF